VNTTPKTRRGTTASADSQKDIYRVLDANINRAKEGLRVCEDIARFCLKDVLITKRLRRIRHAITTVLKNSRVDRRAMMFERKVAQDPGKEFANQTAKSSFAHLFCANIQRAKEALRVIEEFLKLLDLRASRLIQKIRFDTYELEKKTVKKFPSLLDP
jgi:thiamine-phosphate pyrophosphorylase